MQHFFWATTQHTLLLRDLENTIAFAAAGLLAVASKSDGPESAPQLFKAYAASMAPNVLSRRQSASDIRTVHELLGYKDVQTNDLNLHPPPQARRQVSKGPSGHLVGMV